MILIPMREPGASVTGGRGSSERPCAAPASTNRLPPRPPLAVRPPPTPSHSGSVSAVTVVPILRRWPLGRPLGAREPRFPSARAVTQGERHPPPFPSARGHCPERPLRNPGGWQGGGEVGPLSALPCPGTSPPGVPRPREASDPSRAQGGEGSKVSCPTEAPVPRPAPVLRKGLLSPPQGTGLPASCCLARNAVHPAGPAWTRGLTALSRGEFILPRAHFTECWH